jgi:hypothetical protein
MSLSALDPVAGHVICSLQMLSHPESASQRLRLGSKQHEAAAADQDLPYASQRLLSSTTYSVFLLNTGFEGLPRPLDQRAGKVIQQAATYYARHIHWLQCTMLFVLIWMGCYG